MTPTVALFDIDGTLTVGTGAGGQALRHVMADLYGRADAFDGATFHGNTDRSLIRGALEAIGRPASDGAIDAVIARYRQRLPHHLRHGDYRPQPGARDLLDALTALTGLACGLGTGNIEVAGRMKLWSAGYEHDRLFPFGGFGCDAEDRAGLIATGARRGAAHLGVALASCRVVVIGDTLKDVQAAHAVGAACLAVATGGASAGQLRQSGAECVVDTLEDRAAWRFLGLSPAASG